MVEPPKLARLVTLFSEKCAPDVEKVGESRHGGRTAAEPSPRIVWNHVAIMRLSRGDRCYAVDGHVKYRQRTTWIGNAFLA